MAAPRAVLDTNVFISTFLLHGRSALLAKKLFEGKFTLLVSEPILEEYYGVAIRPRFRASRLEIKALFENLTPWMHFLHRPHPLAGFSFQDPSDLKFIECAISAGAGHLVTGDRALLGLKRYRKVSIVSIASFLQVLDG